MWPIHVSLMSIFEVTRSTDSAVEVVVVVVLQSNDVVTAWPIAFDVDVDTSLLESPAF